MTRLRYRSAVLVVCALAVLNLCVFSALTMTEERRLHVSVLDVGQGDAVLVEGPTGSTMLIDSGPDRTVLRRLAEELGPLDRAIDLAVETHPDADHISGFPGVFENYAVAGFMEPGFDPDTDAAAAVAAAWEKEPDAKHLIARRGMRINLGGGAYADVLSPDRDPNGEDTNEGSITMHVVYGTTSFMLTGDLPSAHEDWLAYLDKGDGELPSNVLKAGHHGSKNSTDDEWLSVIAPAAVAISAGKDNPYGHPNPETLARIKQEGAATYSTIDSGTLHFISDGTAVVEH